MSENVGNLITPRCTPLFLHDLQLLVHFLCSKTKTSWHVYTVLGFHDQLTFARDWADVAVE